MRGSSDEMKEYKNIFVVILIPYVSHDWMKKNVHVLINNSISYVLSIEEGRE